MSASVRRVAARVASEVPWILKLGSGFFADAYDLFAMDICIVILEHLEGDVYNVTSNRKAMVMVSPSLGAVVGMLLFGVIADRFGHRRTGVVTASLVALGSLLSALCLRSFDVIIQLSVVRFLLGVGIGGEYPVCAALAREDTSKGHGNKSAKVAAVFCMQGIGMVWSMVLALLVVSGLGVSLEVAWRVLLGFGTFPALFAAYHRHKVPQVFEKNTDDGELEPTSPTSPSSEPSQSLSNTFRTVWDQRAMLFVTAVSWFLLDVTFYGSGQFKHEVYDALHPKHDNESARSRVRATAMFGLYVGLMGLPGYFGAAYLFHRGVSKWRVQLAGFLALATCYACFAAALTQLTTSAPVGGLLLFGASFFLSNLGPNTTTFVIPSEVFPHEVRTTTHGISAACGKLGAVVGALLFAEVDASLTLWLCVPIALVGGAVTVRGLTLPPRLLRERESFVAGVDEQTRPAELMNI